MIPERFEYLTVLVFLMFLLIALFTKQTRQYLCQTQYLVGLTMFFVFAFVLELVALAQNWWVFFPNKLLGIGLFGVPLEEMLLFAGFYFIVVVGWEEISNDLD